MQGGIPVWRAVGGLGAGAVDSVDDSAYTPLISDAGVALLAVPRLSTSRREPPPRPDTAKPPPKLDPKGPNQPHR